MIITKELGLNEKKRKENIAKLKEPHSEKYRADLTVSTEEDDSSLQLVEMRKSLNELSEKIESMKINMVMI